MDIKRNGSQPSVQGPVDRFTGTVLIDPLFAPAEPARLGGAYVTLWSMLATSNTWVKRGSARRTITGK